MVQSGTDPDYLDEADLLLHPSVMDGEVVSTCVCSPPHGNYTTYNNTLDGISEDVDEDAESSSCSPSCDCDDSSSSSSSPCQSPIDETPVISGVGNGNSKSRREPFYLHPRTDDGESSASSSGRSDVFLQDGARSDRMENRRNHHKHHHQRQPFYLHDPKSLVYTRVKELFGSSTSAPGTNRRSDQDRTAASGSSGNGTQSSLSELTSQAESTDSGSDSAEDDHNNNLILQEESPVIFTPIILVLFKNNSIYAIIFCLHYL